MMNKRKIGDYTIIIDHDNCHHVSLKHKDGRTWSDTVRAMSYLIGAVKKAFGEGYTEGFSKAQDYYLKKKKS